MDSLMHFEIIYQDKDVTLSWREADGMLRISKYGQVMQEVRPPRPKKILILVLALIGISLLLISLDLYQMDTKMNIKR